jgi:hypothetical protein
MPYLQDRKRDAAFIDQTEALLPQVEGRVAALSSVHHLIVTATHSTCLVEVSKHEDVVLDLAGCPRLVLATSMPANIPRKLPEVVT